MRATRLRFAAGLSTFPILGGCAMWVDIPPREADSPPVITFSGVPGPGGVVSKESLTGSDTVSVLLGSNVMFLGSAHSPGGVKSFTFHLQHGLKSTSVTVTGTPNASGKVPDNLAILGSDGAGGPGNQTIILSETPAAAATPLPGAVDVTATNFNGMTTSWSVVYNPYWGSPVIKSFTATPDYMPPGSTSKLEWKIDGCGAYCVVRIDAYDGLSLSTFVEARTNLANSGSISVSPNRSTTTRYVLSASLPLGHNATPWHVDVQLTQGATNTGQTFYLKLENANSSILPCFTEAVYATSEASAEAIAEQENGGYDASPISQSEYLAGCS